MKDDVKRELDSLAKQKRLKEKEVIELIEGHLRGIAEGVLDESKS